VRPHALSLCSGRASARPGIIAGVPACRTYIKQPLRRGRVAIALRCVCQQMTAWRTGADLAKVGVEIPPSSTDDHRQAPASSGTLSQRAWISGWLRSRHARPDRRAFPSPRLARRPQNIDVDAVGVAGGWTPNVTVPVTTAAVRSGTDQARRLRASVSTARPIPSGAVQQLHDPGELSCGGRCCWQGRPPRTQLHGERDSAATAVRRTHRHQPDVACRRST